MIKQNESELPNIVFNIQPNKAYSFFCSLLFVQSFNCLYLWNQLPNLCGAFTKLKPNGAFKVHWIASGDVARRLTLAHAV